MTLLTRYAKQSNNLSSSTATAAVEIAAWTISATDLVTAGFAGGENVVICVQGSLGGGNTGNTYSLNIGHGESFATRTGVATFTLEPDVTTTVDGWNMFWMDRDAAFSATRNWYFGQYVATATGSTGRVRNFSAMFLALDALATTDWNWSEVTGTTATQITYATERGPNFDLQADGSWLIMGQADWDSGSTTADIFQALSVGTATVMEQNFETEDANELFGVPSFTYVATATSGTNIQLLLRSDTASTHQWLTARLLALRLNAFSQATGFYRATSTATSIAPVDTFVEYGNLPFTLTPTATGDARGVLTITMALCSGTSTTWPSHHAYGRILRNSAEWTATDLFRVENSLAGGVPDFKSPIFFGFTCASVTSTATQSFEFEIAEGNTAVNPPVVADNMAALILLELATASASATATATATGTAAMTMRTLATTGVGLAVSAAAVLPQIPWAKKPERWAA